jgi:hypothetical protein
MAPAKDYPPPAGGKVAAGQFFEVYVSKKEEKPAPARYTARVFQVVIVAHTKKHGVQRHTSRIETLDADLLDPKSWEIADLDGDGVEDYRVLKQVTKSGCQSWDSGRWETSRERFTSGGMKLARFVDAHGKPVKNCVLR